MSSASSRVLSETANRNIVRRCSPTACSNARREPASCCPRKFMAAPDVSVDTYTAPVRLEVGSSSRILRDRGDWRYYGTSQCTRTRAVCPARTATAFGATGPHGPWTW